MIDVGQFAKPALNFNSERHFRFGLGNKENCAAILRMMADEIEAGRILLQKVQGGTVAVIDDYFMEALYLEFAPAEKIVAAPEEPKQLYGPGQFAVAIRESSS